MIKNANPSLWDVFLKKIIEQPVDLVKDRQIVEAAREKLVEIRKEGFKITTNI